MPQISVTILFLPVSKKLTQPCNTSISMHDINRVLILVLAECLVVGTLSEHELCYLFMEHTPTCL